MPPPPDGFVVRPATVDDADAVSEVGRAYDSSLNDQSSTTPEDLRDWWRLIDLERQSWLVERDGRVAAAAVAYTRGEFFDAGGYVHPDFQGRGLGSFLLDVTEARARELGLPCTHATTLARDAAALELFARRGYRDVRHYYRMVIDLDGPTPEPAWPDGLEVETFRLEDALAFHAVLDEAFEEEWNFQSTPFEEWRTHRLEAPDFDPDVWWVVRDGDELAAVLRGDPKREGMGWVGALGVRRRWRRRGLGLALLHHAFGEFRRRGETAVGLGVDAENPTGATRLYERAGMRVAREAIVFAKELD